MFKQNFIYSFFVILTITSCEKTEKVDDFPKHQSKLVTNCLFESGQGFRFKLFKSLSAIDNAPFKELTNANAYIKIFENNTLFDSLTYHATLTSSFFSGDSNKRVKPNNSYRFDCYYPGFSNVSAEDYMPDTVDIQKIKGYYTVLGFYGSDDTLFTGGRYFTNVNIDLGNSAKYLIIQLSAYSTVRKGPYSSNYESRIFDLTDLNSTNTSQLVINSLYVSNISGIKTLNLKWMAYGDLYKDRPSYVYKIKAYTCSENTFEYLRRRALQVQNNDDPFSQPTPISNNIVNGYGIFGGVNAITRSFSF